MNARKIINVVLLLFVAASLAAWAVREFHGPQPASTPPPPGAVHGKQVVAYYFHRSERCETCNKLEAYSHEALAAGFADELADGRMAWQVVNYQEPAGEHFRDDFGLIAPSLVLAEVRNGRAVRHRELSDIWTLVDDKPAFLAYVQRQTKEFLDSE
jgi:hypothetical protein